MRTSSAISKRSARNPAHTNGDPLGFLIDTSVLIALERGDIGVAGLPADRPAVSVVSVSELLHGVHRAPQQFRRSRLTAVEEILASFQPFPVTEPVARVHALVTSELARRGQSIGVNDSWIGATALTHGLAVLTRNPRDFERIPSLRVLAA
jgi:tRNA(fMet)-specific endonuclease VapC